MTYEQKEKRNTIVNGLLVFAAVCLVLYFFFSLAEENKPDRIFPVNQLSWQEISAQPFDLELPPDLSRQGGELELDRTVYQGEGCAVRLSHLQQETSGRYHLFFQIDNDPQNRRALTLGRMEYQPNGWPVWDQKGHVELLVGEDWLPCEWCSLSPNPATAHAQYGVTLDNIRYDAELWRRQLDTGKVRLRFSNLTLNQLTPAG